MTALIVALHGSAQVGRADVVVQLIDGSTARGDKVTVSEDRKEIIVTVRKPGIQMSRRIPVERVSTVIDPARMHATGGEAESRDCCGPHSGRAVEAPRMAGIPTRSVVIGVRRDPLEAYGRVLRKEFPDGVPQLERGFVRELMRQRAFYRLLPPPPPYRGRPPKGVAPPPPPMEPADVEGISIDARAVPAAGQADWDSLAVTIRPSDARGRAVAARGTYRITLWGLSGRPLQTIGEEVVLLPERIERIGRWNGSLEDGKPVGNATEIVLPLGRSAPDHNSDVFPLGLVNVELSVPGRGVFSASRGDVPLTQQSLVRSFHLDQTGTRFLPEERTTGPKVSRRNLLIELSTLRPKRRVLSIKP